MKHVFQRTKNARGTMIALHGTGGDEHSLIAIAHRIAPDMNFLGIRGNVDENGLNRYFKRLAEGVFDEEDLRFRTDELAQFIKQATEDYAFSWETTFLLGYSNGANIAANLMLRVEDIAKGAILLHAMVPSREWTDVTLQDKVLFLSAGMYDPLIPIKEVEDLHAMLVEKKATIELRWEDNTHQISRSEIEAARNWLASIVI